MFIILVLSIAFVSLCLLLVYCFTAYLQSNGLLLGYFIAVLLSFVITRSFF